MWSKKHKRFEICKMDTVTSKLALTLFLIFSTSSFPVILGAIQIIRDTLGGRGGSKKVTRQFLMVISLVKVDKKCHMGGGGGSKKCGKSVTYYLNGPLYQSMY
jgi:hypothetical protein